MRALKTIAIMGLLCALPFGLSSCGLFAKDPPPPPKTAAPATWVILVDLTLSTAHDRAAYVAALDQVLKGLGYGDQLAVVSIQSQSVTEARYLCETQLPAFMFTPAPKPSNDNQDAQNGWRSEEQTRHARELAGFESAHPLNAIRRRILRLVTPAILRTRIYQTDIFGSLQLASQILSTAAGPRRLVLLSDGEVREPRMQFPVSLRRLKRIVAAQKSSQQLPDLYGARVLFVGADAPTAGQFASLEGDWCYYLRASRGQLERRFFMRRMSSLMYGAWLRS